MRIRLSQIAALALLSAVSGTCFAADPVAGVNAAVESHKNGAPDKGHELRLVDDLTKLSAAAPKDWRADFWAAYFLTQVTMSHRDGAAELLVKSQEHLDRAFTRAESSPGAPLADLHALQSLVYQFQSTYATERESGLRFQELDAQALDKAFELDRESPVIMVMAATSVIGANGEKTWPQVIAARALLAEADRRFSSETLARGETANFNSEWVNPWLGWVDRMIANGLDAE